VNCWFRWDEMVVHCANGLYCVSLLRVHLSVWFVGREKVTRDDGLVEAALAEAAILLALSRFVRVRWAIGCVFVEGVGAATTLGGDVTTLGGDAITLGADAWLSSPLEVLLGVCSVLAEVIAVMLC